MALGVDENENDEDVGVAAPDGADRNDDEPKDRGISGANGSYTTEK